MAELTLKVGASVDRNLQVAFQPLVDGAKRARSAIEAESKKTSTAISKETKKGTKDAEARFKELEEEIRTGMPRATNAATAAVKSFSKEASSNFARIKREFGDVAKEAEREISKVERAQRKVTPKGFRFGTESGIVTDLAKGGGHLAAAGARAALGITRSLAHGAGVDTDFASIMRRNVELESMATALSNKSVISRDPRNALRVDPQELMRQALDTSKRTGTDANSTLAGLGHFVDLTGDLATGRELLSDLEQLAKGSGVAMEDMVTAAGELSLALGHTEGKSEKIVHLMRQFTGQAEMGAISVADLSKNLAKIASSAGQFEGDRSKNIAFLGVIGQEARRGGGSNSSSQAATAVAGFVNTLKTPARVKAFEKATGKSIFDSTGTMMRDPEVLLREAITAKGMKPLEFKEIFRNMKGAQGPEALATVFRQAGGGAAGEAAVTAAIDEIKKAIISKEQANVNFAASLSTTESKANVFNNEMREQVLSFQNAAVPLLQLLGPPALEAAKFAGETAAWLSKLIGPKPPIDPAGAAVDTAIRKTKEQLKNGGLHGDQVLADAKAESDVRAALAKSKAEGATGGLGTLSKAALTAFDYTPPGLVWGALGGGKVGESVIEKNQQDQRGNATQTEVLTRQLGDMVRTNQEIKFMLANGLKITQMPAPGARPPATNDDGQQPAPEDKPR